MMTDLHYVTWQYLMPLRSHSEHHVKIHVEAIFRFQQ
jgi:hypothetical protein